MDLQVSNRKTRMSSATQNDEQTKEKEKHLLINNASAIVPVTDDHLHEPNPVALLDMLAEVASATLKNDLVLTPAVQSPIVKPKPSSPVSTSRRTPYNSDLLNLDQIRMLSDRLLLNMFSDQTADELRKTYTFTCYLMPEKCQQTYSSFGNEYKARLLMKTHLLAHIAELVVEDNKPNRSPDRKFIAETLNARKKRLAATQGSRRRVLKKNTRAMRAKRLMAQTKEKPKTGTSNSKSSAVSTDSIKTSRLFPPESKEDSLEEQVELNGIIKVDIKPQKDEGEKSKAAKKRSPRLNGTAKGKQMKSTENDVTENTNKSSGQKAPRTRKRKRVCETSEASTETKFPNEEESEEKMEEIEFVVSRDHNYTRVEGKSKDWETLDNKVSDDEAVVKEKVYRYPIINEGSVNVKSPNYEVIVENNSLVNIEHMNTLLDPLVAQLLEIETMAIETKESSNGREPAMLEGVALQTKPKRVRRINKIIVPEEYASESSDSTEDEDEVEDEDEMENSNATSEVVEKSSKGNETSKVQTPKEGTPEWERKLALKCIRMLRTRRKDERITLVCKICRDKIFTAQATLMYHYRSHAGIKPFVCNICNTTFTRQHSLNYHMLIHNNKSRFTCVECGRKFRHPSHFKEHMRRHTGETPFECADCGLRFKTRNTYKRHLKTRHGKLLTATGIVVLSSEEFLRVKTNPRKKTNQRKDKETQWPDAEYSAAGSSPSSTSQRSDKVTVKYCNELKLTSAMVQKHLKKSP